MVVVEVAVAVKQVAVLAVLAAAVLVQIVMVIQFQQE
jgi:hypothetical protein